MNCTTDLQTFKDDYLLRNGDIPDEVALAKAPVKLKEELIEVTSVVDILTGGVPTAWAEDVEYDVCIYVSYNGVNYKSLQAHTSTSDNYPQENSDYWELVEISAAGGGGNSEDIIYQLLLDNSHYQDAFYDIFANKDFIQSTDATFSSSKTNVTGVSDNTLTTENLLSDNSELLSDLLVYWVNPEDNITVEYSSDNSNWTTLPDNKRIVLNTETGLDPISDIYLKFTWNGDGVLENYGVLFNTEGLTYTSNTKLFETVVLSSDISAGTEYTIPNNKAYDTDGKSLMIYVNRLRMFIGVDYEEINNTTIKWLVDLKTDDSIVFEQQYGYVDLSFDNKDRLNLEHDLDGNHILTDKSTSTKYQLTVDDGTIVLVEQ